MSFFLANRYGASEHAIHVVITNAAAVLQSTPFTKRHALLGIVKLPLRAK